MNNEQAADLAVSKRLIEDMHTRLFGEDGESGKLGKLDERVEVLEKTKARGEGILWALTTLISVVGGSEIFHWMRSK